MSLISNSLRPKIALKIMEIVGMNQTFAAGIRLGEVCVRDQDKSHIIFESIKCVNDAHNGQVFAKFMSANNAAVDCRRVSAITVNNSDLLRLFV